MKSIGSLLILAGIIIRFAYWQRHPSLLSASIFWGVILAGFIIIGIAERSSFKVLPRAGVISGAALNAVCILSNGGFMPTSGETSHSVWVTSNSTTHNLLFLSDRYGGVSIGDFIIFGSLLMLLGYWLTQRWKA